MQQNNIPTKMSPKDFFLQVGTMATLYFGVFNFLSLVFRIIDFRFPDRLQRYVDPYSGDIRFAIASLLVIVPVHLFLMWLLNRDYAAMPEKRNFPVRKWLVYLTLFAAGTAIVIDLILLINTFLGGEISTRFGLKVAAVLLVAGAVFWYYIADLRRASAMSASMMRIFMGLILALVIGTIILGFFVMGSPATQRQFRFDAQRVEHLNQIQWQVISYWQQKQKLPASLNELNDPISSFMIPTDPANDEAYEYRPLSPLKFELCATFSLPTPANPRKGMPEMPTSMTYDVVGPEATNWKHEAGRQCYERAIDPDRYPPTEKRSLR